MVRALLLQALKTKTMDLTKQKTHSNADILSVLRKTFPKSNAKLWDLDNGFLKINVFGI